MQEAQIVTRFFYPEGINTRWKRFISYACV